MKLKLTALSLTAAMLFSVFTTGCQVSSISDLQVESGVIDSEFDDGTMRSDMSAMDYAKDMGIGINLGNTFEGYWEDKSNVTSGASLIGDNTPQNYETCWGACVTTQECIDGMAKVGFSTVRIPVYWGNMMEDDGTFTINEDYIARIKEVVDYCRKDGLYVVINDHHYDEFIIKNYPEEEALEITATIWKQIAEYFKNYSDYLIFEGFNENVGSQREEDTFTEDELYDYANALNQTFVDTVRSTGGNNAERVLIASGYWTNIDMTTSDSFIMPTDTAEDRLMISVHYIDNACYWSNSVGNGQWQKYATAQCDELKAAFLDKGIPVFVGETTSIYEDDHIIAAEGTEYDNSQACLSYILNLAVDYGCIPVLWDVNNNFYSRTEYRIINGDDQAVISEIAAKIAQ